MGSETSTTIWKTRGYEPSLVYQVDMIDGMPMDLGCKAPCTLQMHPHGQSATFLLKTHKQGKQSQQMQLHSVSPGPAL